VETRKYSRYRRTTATVPEKKEEKPEKDIMETNKYSKYKRTTATAPQKKEENETMEINKYSKYKRTTAKVPEKKEEKPKEEPTKYGGRRNYFNSENLENKIPEPKKDESNMQKSSYGRFRQFRTGQENDQIKKNEKQADSAYTSGFSRKTFNKNEDNKKLEKNDEKPVQVFQSKYQRKSENIIKDEKNVDVNKQNRFIFKGKSSYNIHKKEDTDNKKIENGGFKREINKSQLNLRGDKNNTVTTATTTTTTEKYGTNNVMKPVYISRRRQEMNSSTGVQPKIETKNENVDQGVKRRYNFTKGK
jgi:hypothetical protein